MHETAGHLKVPRILLTGYPWPLYELAGAFLLRPVWKTRVLPILPSPRRVSWPISTLQALRRSDLWYQVGGSAMKGLNWLLSDLSSRLEVPVIIHWTGTDVLVARKRIERSPRLKKLLTRVHHWACAPWLAAEVSDLGFQCDFVPLPKTRLARLLDAEPPPLPEEFRILTYLNDRMPTKYGTDEILRLARDFPDVTIKVAGATGRFLNHHPSNVNFLGWVEDMRAEYAACTAVVRLVEHDGYGGTIQEALACGRQAIWTYPMPGVQKVQTYQDLKNWVGHLLKRHEEGALALNHQGRQFLKANMHRTLLDRRIVESVERLLGLST